MGHTVQNNATITRFAPNVAQRVYGVTFPDKKQMEEYKKRVEEAKKRDHRRLGTQQKLFFFDPVSPGSAFFLPHGMTICRRLIQVSCVCSSPALF
jgi:threonyl-tRNA synthetase